MNKDFVLPVCFAAAAHGALLFGFTKEPRAQPAPKEKTVITIFEWPKPPEEVKPVEVDTSEVAPKGKQDVSPPPRTVEPINVSVNESLTFTPPAIPPVNSSEVKAITGETLGLPEGATRWTNVIPSDHLDRAPRSRSQTSPVYPFEAKKDGRTGNVVVEFMVDESGTVVDPRVVTSTDRVFEEASLRAVAKWRFEPGKREGRIVRFRMAVPLVFNLNE